MKYHNNDTYATSPGRIKIANIKLKKLLPELYGISGLKIKILSLFGKSLNLKACLKEHLFYGDSQPAIVISVSPLLVAAYSEDIDCVAMLKFPQDLSTEYNLEEKSRLLSINTYISQEPYQKDLIPGPLKDDTWYGFHPVIADFVSNDFDQIKKRKSAIDEEIWDYVYKLGIEYQNTHPNTWRDGRPFYSRISAIE